MSYLGICIPVFLNSYLDRVVALMLNVVARNKRARTDPETFTTAHLGFVPNAYQCIAPRLDLKELGQPSEVPRASRNNNA